MSICMTPQRKGVQVNAIIATICNKTRNKFKQFKNKYVCKTHNIYVYTYKKKYNFCGKVTDLLRLYQVLKIIKN